MSGDNSTEGFRETRSVLGDVTNRPGKRGLLIFGSSVIKSGDGNSKNVNDKVGDSAQQVCLGVENIVKEKCRTSFVANDNDKGKRACVSLRPCSEINSLRGNIVSSISKIPCEVKESNSFGGSGASIDNVVEVGDASRDSCVSSISIPTGFGSCAGDSCGVEEKCGNDEGRVTSEVAQSDPLAAHVCKTDGMDQGVDDLVSTKYGSVGCSTLPKSRNSKSIELERCIGLKGDGSSNSSVGVDLIKDCSCSFCTKVAYIWADLLYQDVKGRMAALKKSQKEASILVQKSCRDKGIDKHGQGNSNKILKLESELMGQWRSLFLRMEDILVHESSQLEASLLPLKDLRENCKTTGVD
uniref:DNA-directed RNA polymerase n=1 Tax=Davidia involucrata TaxID=16924 RepID=A0A5B6YQU9_DAVIN